ncbi:asparaginase [Streptomyces sp. V3I7]|uniref:asparaginase n=1 Tax=Streptomyces sp. V3I7 TaxID=3042278 RepID=UPI002785AC45|nr:asparaginase [Streptomyces sp. V3I7]MDQ0994693.1 L-asparaginase [Streptomyces sp. V3I7]
MRVALFALGGTISVTGGEPRLTGEQIVAAVPGLERVGARIDVQDAEAVPSSGLTFVKVLEVVDAASRAVADGATGAVVLQGTDTLEETAFLADLVWPHPQPLVLTGAMRNASLAGADGAANVLAAVRVACAPEARGLGALVVFNDQVHAARWVRKTHSTSTATFVSPNTGPLGHVVEDRVRVLAAPPRLDPLPYRPTPAQLAATRVGVYTAVLDEEDTVVDDAARGCQGLVVAGFGAGHVAGALAPRLGALTDRIPVVLTSRTGSGSVLRATYRSPGSESDLLSRGLIDAGMLDPWKARVLLRLLLAGGAGRDEIAAAFSRWG